MSETRNTGEAGNSALPMRRIAISLLKGGVAKSETAVHLAHGLSLAGYRVLLVDTDVQSHCGEMLGVFPDYGLAHVVGGVVEPLEALFEARENLWLLSGGNDLAGIKMEIARREIAPEAVLADTLEQYEGGFDFMIMDTAPGWDTLLVNALYASREILSPVSMEPMALSGLARFQERLEVIRRYNPHLAMRWILPTFVDGRVRKSAEIMQQLQDRYGDLLVEPIKYSVKLSEATAYGKTIFEHDPHGLGAEGYGKLVERVILDTPVGWQQADQGQAQTREDPRLYLAMRPPVTDQPQRPTAPKATAPRPQEQPVAEPRPAAKPQPAVPPQAAQPAPPPAVRPAAQPAPPPMATAQPPAKQAPTPALPPPEVLPKDRQPRPELDIARGGLRERLRGETPSPSRWGLKERLMKASAAASAASSPVDTPRLDLRERLKRANASAASSGAWNNHQDREN